MAGFGDDSSGFDVVYADNVDFSGSLAPQASVTTDGQLLIGSTTLPHIRVGNIVSSDGSIKVTNTSGAINLSGTAQGFQPNAVLQEFDDFLAADTAHNSTNFSGKLCWFPNNTYDQSNGTANNPGIITWAPNSSSSTFDALFLPTVSSSGTEQAGPIVPGGGAITMSWIAQMSSLSGGGNTFRYDIGFCDVLTVSNSLRTYVNGMFFTYTDTVNSGNWQIICTNASVSTTVNTTVAATTSFTTFTIQVNAAGTSVSFFINNVLVGSAITTNIPTTAITPFFQATRTAGTVPAMSIDLFWITINLSNPRPGPTAGNIPANNRLIENYVQTAINYSVLGTDAIVGISNTGAPRTITMPAINVNTGQRWTIKDESGGAGTNNITVSGNGFNIDGAATKVINTNFGSLDIYFNGSNYFII